jgi:hypothetical protein
LNLRGQALRKAVGLAARALGTAAAGMLADAGLVLVGHRRLTAALALDWGPPPARAQALRLGLEAVERWAIGLEQHPRLSAERPPLQAGMDTITQITTPAIAPAPAGGPGGKRLKQHVAPDRRIAIADAAMRHGRKSSANTCNGCKEPLVLALASTVTREVVGCPANEPEEEAVEWVAAELARGQGLRQLDIALGDMASPRMAHWAEQGGYSMARPWPQGGPLFTQDACTLDLAPGMVTCAGGQPVPMVPGKDAQFSASAWDACPQRAPCTTARLGHGRSLPIREDDQCQPKLRTKSKTKRGRASLRKRTAVEQAISHHVAHQGRRARSKGLRTNQFDGRRHAAVSNLQVAAHYVEERQLAS